MFMQPGFAMLEAGFSRAKNVTNVLMKNLVDYAVGSLAFFAVGYAIMMGTPAYFLSGDAYDVGTILNWYLCDLQCRHLCDHISDLRPLALGRWVVEFNRLHDQTWWRIRCA